MTERNIVDYYVADEAQRLEFERMIEDGHDDLDRNGCVSPDEVERSCKEAISRGLALRQTDRENRRRMARNR